MQSEACGDEGKKPAAKQPQGKRRIVVKRTKPLKKIQVPLKQVKPEKHATTLDDLSLDDLSPEELEAVVNELHSQHLQALTAAMGATAFLSL